MSHVRDVQRDRIGTSKAFAAVHGVHVALKGARTVIATPAGEVYVNPTGNAGMGSGGTGDALSGLVGGLLAQGYDADAALIVGCYVHGLAGDRAAAIMGQHGMLARDLITQIGPVLKSWEED